MTFELEQLDGVGGSCRGGPHSSSGDVSLEVNARLMTMRNRRSLAVVQGRRSLSKSFSFCWCGAGRRVVTTDFVMRAMGDGFCGAGGGDESSPCFCRFRLQPERRMFVKTVPSTEVRG